MPPPLGLSLDYMEEGTELQYQSHLILKARAHCDQLQIVHYHN